MAKSQKSNMFNLHRQTVVLSNFNPRSEKHGDKNVPASDLKFTMIVPNTMLDCFEVGLRAALYRKELSGEMPPSDLADQGTAPADGLVKAKFGSIKGFDIDKDYPGYRLGVFYGIADTPPIELDECLLHKVHIDFKDGGSVYITLTVTCKPTKLQVAEFYEMQRAEMTINLTAPDNEAA